MDKKSRLKKSKSTFIVRRLEDLNDFPELKFPYQKFVKGISDGYHSMMVELPFLGYVPGQDVKFKIFVENQSFIDSIKEIKVKFKKIVRLSSDKFVDICNYDETKLYETIIHDVKGYQEEVFQLPTTLTLTDTQYCSLIKVFYELKIVAVAAGLNDENLEVKIPIFIGSIKLNNEIPTLSSNNNNNNIITIESLEQFTSKNQSTFTKNRTFFIFTIFLILSIFYICLISMGGEKRRK